MPLTIADITAARGRIAPYIRHTPLLRAEGLDDPLGCRVFLKPECLQVTGAFKIRGALSKVLSLPPEVAKGGIIASSAGNHAIGCACAGRLLGIPAVLVLPENAPKAKVEGTRAYGAEVIQWGIYSGERWQKCYEIAAEKGCTVVHSFDDEQVMAGQGTIGCEILEDEPDMDTVIIPLGGGGLTAGVATALTSLKPGIRVVAVEPARCNKYNASRAAGRRVELKPQDTVADGLKLNITGELAFEVIERLGVELVTVEEDAIAEATRLVAAGGKVLAEPSSCVGAAAILSGTIAVGPEEKVCLLLSGGNWDVARLGELYAGRT